MSIFSFKKNKKEENTLITFDFLCDSYFCQIKTDTPQATDELLIISYIFFLARYFFICDERQLKPMKKILLNEASGNSFDFDKLINNVGKVVYDSLEDYEKEQLNELSVRKMALPVELTDKNLEGTLGKYKFTIVREDNYFRSIFDMSDGLDIVLLPRLVVFLYGLVKVNLQTPETNKKFSDSIKAFLNEYKEVDKLQEQEVFINLPLKIMAEILKEL